MTQLDKLASIDDIRSIWRLETDFTKWLAEGKNLKVLSDAVGFSIILMEQESSVGNFRVDLYATTEFSDKKIIIENQLENTNHDHFGKLLTYAACKSADYIIWIVKKAREEHRQAIAWLNQHTDEETNFFLIEIEVWKIGDSLPAPKFNIVEQPNNWGKVIKTSTILSYYRTQKTYCIIIFGGHLLNMRLRSQTLHLSLNYEMHGNFIGIA